MPIDESLFDDESDDLVGRIVSFRYNSNDGPPLSPKISNKISNKKNETK